MSRPDKIALTIFGVAILGAVLVAVQARNATHDVVRPPRPSVSTAVTSS